MVIFNCSSKGFSQTGGTVFTSLLGIPPLPYSIPWSAFLKIDSKMNSGWNDLLIKVVLPFDHKLDYRTWFQGSHWGYISGLFICTSSVWVLHFSWHTFRLKIYKIFHLSVTELKTEPGTGKPHYFYNKTITFSRLGVFMDSLYLVALVSVFKFFSR